MLENRPNHLAFRDRYQITWQFSLPGDDFGTSGEFAGRWIRL
jgi:hypothetical protein